MAAYVENCSGWLVGGVRVGFVESTADRVKRLERDRNDFRDEAVEADRKLTEARAKLAVEEKAKRDAEEAKRTYGQRIAAEMVKPYSSDTEIHLFARPGLGGQAFADNGSGTPILQKIEQVKGYFASALDKAYADGADAQREKDAMYLAVKASAFWSSMGYTGKEIGDLLQKYSAAVRANK